MKRIFLCLIFCLAAICAAAGQQGSEVQLWPDGSAIDGWFFDETLRLGAAESTTFPITDYGAAADSTILQTEVIQKAIDAAAVNGGTVVIPKGVWLTSSLFFKPHTHLRLEKGAVLKGSDDVSDYDVEEVHIEGKLQPYIAAVVNAYSVDGFSITGEGIIDGQGHRFWRDFWKRKEVNPECTNLEALRPRLVYIANSADVHIEGVTFRNPGFWTTHLYKCRRVRIKEVMIFAPLGAPSSDGIDVDACEDVHITGCDISVDDDIVSIKGGKGPWADRDTANGTNARILVEKCRFGTGCSAVTFGSECIGGRNVILRNSEVHGTDKVLMLKMRPDTPQHYEYIMVEGITGETNNFLFVHPWTQFFDLKGREDIPMSYGEHITIQNCDVKCSTERNIVEQPDQYVLTDLMFE